VYSDGLNLDQYILMQQFVWIVSWEIIVNSDGCDSNYIV